MDSRNDKIMGSLLGLAIGDALAAPARGLKPETIQQLFKQMDGFKDVRPFLGKGVKRYRMRGLYGAQTQLALAVCDALLIDKKAGIEAVAERLRELSSGGPEGRFGMYRSPEGVCVRALESLVNRDELLDCELKSATLSFSTMAIPAALYYQKTSATLLRLWLETSLMMSRHLWEATGAALTGFATLQLLDLEAPSEDETPERVAEILKAMIAFCAEVNATFKDLFPEAAAETNEKLFKGFTVTLEGLLERFDEPEAELFAWISKNASEFAGVEIRHPNQGHPLTLIPLALILLSRVHGFSSVMTQGLNMGRETEKIGSLLGAWAGAWYGEEAIPQEWRTGLVNAREIKSRGKALARKGNANGLKELYELESGATSKNYQEEKKYVQTPTTRKASGRDVLPDIWSVDGDDDEHKKPLRDDPIQRRKFERDKARKKKDRRKNLPSDMDFF
ncbi:MAG: hypothetical protein G3M78_03435 [Candidatus Nitrohelix vancouverensis]|uniref:ADP-ribosylglycohydrolase n=1 Tax=Candidatus Nitrohelix vancouverensis TaxID=2705534 RepID=A0A7T0G2M6_9BACT|nr:MAG: hypothetical protein G3M78_03435 [Candidatus Nitrohelix vancouverensis]